MTNEMKKIERLRQNNQNFEALIIPEQVKDIDKLLQNLTPILNLTSTEIERIKKDISRHKRFIPIKIKDNCLQED